MITIQNRLSGLDFLKFMAAVMITNSHFIPVYKDVNVGLATLGVHGNALFFYVSGFLLMKGLQKKVEHFDNWYKRRLQRLWPAVFLWAVFAAIVWGDNLSWQKILVAPDYWFLQTIAVYYLLFYWTSNMIIRLGGGYLKGLFVSSVVLSVITAILLPQSSGSIFHTQWHYVCHFSVMIMGAMTYIFQNQVKCNRFWLDLQLWVVSFIAYFVILSCGKNATDWRWYSQIAALIPLHAFCYYSYKVCAYKWCEKLMTHKIWGVPLCWIASLTLEIYVVQFHLITDRFNALFPLNWFIVFVLVCVVAYILRMMVNIFLQFLSKENWRWKECFRL